MTPDDERAELEEANARFYRVFESLELPLMEQVWAHGDHVRCVHPGWCMLAGWEAVRRSWEAIFKNSHEMRFSIGDVHAYVEGGFGWVTCTENILSETRGNISVTSVLATNIFERSAGGDWLMIHHHASHILTGDPAGRGDAEGEPSG
jgi:ketosteroid isomerase-like protein